MLDLNNNRKKLHWNFHLIHISFFIDAIEMLAVYNIEDIRLFKDEQADDSRKLWRECRDDTLPCISCAEKLRAESKQIINKHN
jgi:hypothetical protein